MMIDKNVEPFFDGKAFFGEKPKSKFKLNFAEKILFMPILLIVLIVKWIIRWRKI